MKCNIVPNFVTAVGGVVEAAGRAPFRWYTSPTHGPTVPDSRGGAKMQRCQDLKSGIDVEACWERVSGEDGRRAVRADE